MEIRVIDFEVLTTHYKNYRDGVDVINSERENVLRNIDPIKKEMNKIISSATNGLIMDGKTQKQQSERFQELQQEVMKVDADFKVKNKQMVDELNTTCYDELSLIITDWSKANSIDLVSGKMEIIYCNDSWDVTNEIVEILKQKDLYVDREIVNKTETEKESA